jgi:hypothetical protein
MWNPYRFLWHNVLQLKEPFTAVLCRQVLYNGILFWAFFISIQWYFYIHVNNFWSVESIAWIAFDAWLIDHLVRHIVRSYTWHDNGTYTCTEDFK